MSFVYLIKTRDLEEYKIGFTKGNVEKRLKNLQTGCPSELVLVECFESEFSTKIESSLHFMWDHYRVSGEWFYFPNNEQNKFNQLCEQLHSNFHALESHRKETHVGL